ncbi:MAG: Hsp20/alpha crystallin family protein [Planctomycetota bacterium]|jgi:HSP20 family protein
MRMIPYGGEEFGLPALQNRMNRLFESFFREGEPGFLERPVVPPIDVIDTPETLQIKAEVPGIEPKDIDISIIGDTLTIKGEKSTEREEKGKNWYRRERTTGNFLRTVKLPVHVDAEHIEAIDDTGVLTITLPKLEQAKTTRIPVKAK